MNSSASELKAGQRVRAVLPEVKVVRYYQIENKIHAALAYELGAKIPLMKAAK